MFVFSTIPQYCYVVGHYIYIYGNSNCFLWKTRICLSHIVNTMAADGLATRRKEPGHQQPRYWLSMTGIVINGLICYFQSTTSVNVHVLIIIWQRYEVVFFFNSLWTNDAIWLHISGSTLAQVMACCLTAPSHYLNQCWLITSKIQLHSSDGNFTRDTPVIND